MIINRIFSTFIIFSISIIIFQTFIIHTIVTNMNLNEICSNFVRNFDRKIYKCQKKHDFDNVICIATFNQKFNLKRHQHKMHQKIKVTTFVYCFFIFKQRKNIHLSSNFNSSLVKSFKRSISNNMSFFNRFKTMFSIMLILSTTLVKSNHSKTRLSFTFAFMINR